MLSSTLGLSLQAGPLTEARIARIINNVSVVTASDGTHDAAMNELIKDDTAVKTGIKSRSELLFQDDTLTRLGPESFFSFKPGARDLSLERGTMLLQVPKGIGGAKIRTAAVTAAITGTTIMLEHIPGKTLKVLVLEGSLRLSIDGKFGDSLLLLPGKMVIMAPDAKRIPDPVSVDIAKIMKTSALVNMGGKTKPLPSTGLIQAEIETQSKSKTEHGLVDTNLVIFGAGTKVVPAADDVLAAIDRTNGMKKASLVTSRDSTSSAPQPAPVSVATSSPLPSSTPLATATPFPSATPVQTTTPTPTATPTATAAPAPTPVGDDIEDDSHDDADFDRVVEIESSDNAPKVNVTQPINLTSGGKTGKVKIHAKDSVQIGTSIKVSESAGSKPSAHGGKISVTSQKTSGNAITVTNTGQLLSLLDAASAGPGGSITFRSSGGAVNVTGATLRADRGTIDMRTDGDAGSVNLTGATLHAGTIKLRTLGNQGQLNIGGGKISADTLISLYAGGSNGQVNFTDNVTLSATSVKNISGNTVTVRDGKVVSVTGPAPANVFTNVPNYSGSGGNGSTTGTFGGAGAKTQPLSASPGPGR